MKKEKAERLFREIGEVKGEYVTEEPKKKSGRKAAYTLGIVGAAAVIGLVIWGATPKGKPNLLNYENLPFEYVKSEELAKISADLSNGGMGFEGYMGYDVSDVVGGNPINPEDYEISELPVFKIKGMDLAGASLSLSEEQREERLIRYAEAFGCGTENMDIIKDKFGTKATVSTPEGYDIEIWVCSDGKTRIIFDPMPELPDEYSITDSTSESGVEISEKTLEYLAEEYSEKLGIKDPVCFTRGDYALNYDYNEENPEGELKGECYNRNYYIYEGSDDAFTNLYNYNFKNAMFCSMSDEKNKLWLIWVGDESDTMECEGIYPAIDYEAAKDKLLSGDYVTTYRPDYEITEDMVKYCELTYHRTAGREPYNLPYYRFLIEIQDFEIEEIPELNNYLAVYVPAVEEEYIEEINTKVRFN